MNAFNNHKKNGIHTAAAQTTVREKVEDLKELLDEATATGRKKLTRLQKDAKHAIAEAGDRVEHTAKQVNRKVHKNPWAYIGAAAGAALLVGFVLGMTRRK
jgi:ElaB/YqjD/DUF883 family membrane-anchored ribosome-binding protein